MNMKASDASTRLLSCRDFLSRHRAAMTSPIIQRAEGEEPVTLPRVSQRLEEAVKKKAPGIWAWASSCRQIGRWPHGATYLHAFRICTTY